jgi:hypothetical protein
LLKKEESTDDILAAVNVRLLLDRDMGISSHIAP